MKHKQWITAVMATIALTLASCGTTQKSTTASDATTTLAVVTEKVEASKDFISIAEGIDIFENPEKVTAITKNMVTS